MILSYLFKQSDKIIQKITIGGNMIVKNLFGSFEKWEDLVFINDQGCDKRLHKVQENSDMTQSLVFFKHIMQKVTKKIYNLLRAEQQSKKILPFLAERKSNSIFVLVFFWYQSSLRNINKHIQSESALTTLDKISFSRFLFFRLSTEKLYSHPIFVLYFPFSHTGATSHLI